jgi:hypothetical protein
MILIIKNEGTMLKHRIKSKKNLEIKKKRLKN